MYMKMKARVRTGEQCILNILNLQGLQMNSEKRKQYLKEYRSRPEIKEKEEPLKVIVLDKIAVLVTAAFGLVAALAWNDAIKL